VDHLTDEAAKGRAIADAIRPDCEPLPPFGDAMGFAQHFDRFADARVVLLGEATHGSSEFYRARAAITRRLVEEHGFTIVAVEADWPDAAQIDRHVRHLNEAPTDQQVFARFPTWMWRNEEVNAFCGWLREHNRDLTPDQRTEFRGLDLYSMQGSISAVLGHLGRVDPDAARLARKRYGCLTPWQSEPAWYGRAVLQGDRDPCEAAVTAQLQDVLEKRLRYSQEGGEAYLDLQQNARIVQAAEHYYRIMFHGSTESWNIRDRHMFETLKHLLEARGPGAKAVVWAHNSHIGNASATAMGWQGEFTIGELAKTAFGDAAVLVGFGTDRGTVAAADDWDGPMKVKRVRPSRPDSYERVFLETGISSSLLDLRGSRHVGTREALSTPRLERAIGVIYRPETEFRSHYFQAVLPDQFDAYVWFEETTAVRALPGPNTHGAPDAFPSGL
jgi:erythromycin esterase-like protein